MRWTRAVLILFSAVSLSAQTFEQLTNIRENESPMSVRSAAMGGASDAASPELTQMDANPAALAGTSRLGFSLGAAHVTARIGELEVIDNIVYSTRRDLDAMAFSHVALALPLGRGAVGFYFRNQPAVSDLRSRVATGATDPYVFDCEGCFYVFGARPVAFESRERRYGVAGAWQIGSLAIGAGAELQDVDDRVELVRMRLPNVVAPLQAEQLFRRTSGRKVVPNAGLRWSVTPRVALSAAYQGAAEFDRTSDVCRINFDILERTSPCTSAVARLNASTEHRADALRGGLSVKVSDAMTVVGEAVRRNYGSLAEERFSIIDVPFTLPYRDVTELRAGAEYRRKSFALRAGWWRDPSRFDPELVLAGRIDESVDHLTFGAGIAVAGGRLDVAVDHAGADYPRTISAGFTWSGGL